MKKVFDYAKAQGAQIVHNPADWEGNLEFRLTVIPKSVRTKHLRSLPYKFAPTFLQELRQREEISAKAMIWVLLTACRTSNVCSIRWEDLDVDTNVWTCPAETMKNKHEFKVPIGPELMSWVQAIPPVSEFVFPTGPKKQMSYNTLLALLKRMEYSTETTTHGLRSTFSTWANEKTDYRYDIIEAALSHKVGSQTAQAYNRSDLLEKRRRLMLDWQTYLAF